ncbi:MAG TPA: hypothetical protein V6D13_18490 [Halomicronema sp.]
MDEGNTGPQASTSLSAKAEFSTTTGPRTSTGPSTSFGSVKFTGPSKSTDSLGVSRARQHSLTLSKFTKSSTSIELTSDMAFYL